MSTKTKTKTEAETETEADEGDDEGPVYEGPMYLTPGCCLEAEDWKGIIASLDIYESDPETVEPYWFVSGHDLDNWRARHSRKGAKRYTYVLDPTPVPKCCPFCAKPLPKLVKRKVPLPAVCVCTDGGYYCDTCEERLSSCRCAPPVFAFEPER